MTSVTSTRARVWSAVRISARWDTARRSIEAGRNLKLAEGRLLWLLRDDEPRTLKQIADALELDQSTVNRQVNGALRAGLLTRTRDSQSAAHLFTPSESGRSRFRADLDHQLDVHTAALAAVPAPERDAFLTHLEAYVDALATATER